MSMISDKSDSVGTIGRCAQCGNVIYGGDEYYYTDGNLRLFFRELEGWAVLKTPIPQLMNMNQFRERYSKVHPGEFRKTDAESSNLVCGLTS